MWFCGSADYDTVIGCTIGVVVIRYIGTRATFQVLIRVIITVLPGCCIEGNEQHREDCIYRVQIEDDRSHSSRYS